MSNASDYTLSVPSQNSEAAPDRSGYAETALFHGKTRFLDTGVNAIKKMESNDDDKYHIEYRGKGLVIWIAGKNENESDE